jgi:hypothetical protein
MNKKILIAILSICFVFVVICLSGIAFNSFKSNKIEKIEFPAVGDNTAGQSFKLNIESAVSKELPKTANAIQIKNIKSYTDRELLSIFNLTENKKKKESNYLVYENDEAKLSVYDSGQFLYYSKSNNVFALDKKIELSDKECIEKAKAFLEKNQLLKMDVFDIKVNNITKTDPANLDNEVVIGKDVYFSRSINGREVYGISRIIVTIASNGEISEVRSLFRNTGSSIETKVKTLDKALEAVRKHDAMIEIESGVEKVDIERVEVVYWEDSSPSSETNYIQPLYRFIGKGYDSEGQESEFIAITSMIDEEDTISNVTERKPRNSQENIAKLKTIDN